MPIDIALSTNTAVGALELRQAQPMPDGSGYAALLIVRSGAFAAALPFFVSADGWNAFRDALVGLTHVSHASTALPARLAAREGSDAIELAAAADGMVAISGTLHELEGDQSLRFRFVTDARGLDAFVAAAERLSADA